MNNRALPTVLWIAGLLACGAVLATQLRFSYDLGLFLPAPQTPEQRVLVERLGSAPGASLILAGLPGADEEAVDAAVDRLAGNPLFARALAGPPAPGVDDIPEPVWQHRYVLSDAALDGPGLARGIEARTADLALFAGADFNRLLRADPTLAAPAVLETLGTADGDAERWFTDAGVPVLLVETVA
ncbi:MAG: hypothetical protein AAGD86_00575, partial [Pseudomonadota bacterium]